MNDTKQALDEFEHMLKNPNTPPHTIKSIMSAIEAMEAEAAFNPADVGISKPSATQEASDQPTWKSSYHPSKPSRKPSPGRIVVLCVLGIVILFVVITSLPPRTQEAPTPQPQTQIQEPADTRTFALVTMDTNKLLYLGEGKYETLSVRDSPSMAGTKIGRLERGSRVEILEEGDDTSIKDATTGQWLPGKWVRIRASATATTPTLLGWVFSGYLDKEN